MQDEQVISRARILVIDDEETNITLLKAVLGRAGYLDIIATTDPREVLRLYDKYHPDLILLDLRMPHLDGFAVLDQLKSRIPPKTYQPILVLTADITPDAKRRALSAGAKDFLTKPLDQIEVTLRVRNLLETRILHLELQGQNEILEERVKERTAHLWEALQRLTKSESETRHATEETIRRLAIAAELRDEETGWHIERMSRYTSMLAHKIGMDPARCELLRLASSMHDVGKIGVSDRILLKQGKLTPEEFETIKQHPRIGHRILTDSKTEILQVAATIALTHHERFDGTGYPEGLRGADIPLEGRIAAIGDVFDALTSDRVYRRAFPLGKALEIMKEGRGPHFDPELFDVFIGSLDDALAIMHQYHDEPDLRHKRAFGH